MAVAGIHFGNTNSVITVSKDSKVETVSNETGDRVTPTIVAYTGSEKVIGQPAKQYIIRNPLSCISNIKGAVGRNFTEEDIQHMKNDFPCEVINKNGKIVFKVKVENDTVFLRSSEAASYIFTKLLEIAESIGGSDLEDVVLTVPVNFSEEQRILLSKAAENVGCNVLRLISEPSAALLSLGIGQDDPTVGCTVLVFRLGGTSMDATIMNVNSGMYRFIAQKARQDFGAKKFDEAMVKYLIQEFKRKSKEDISESKRAVGKLRAAIEDCKHGLTNMTSSHFAVDSLYDGIDFNTNILRAKFESICNNLFTECIRLVDDLLSSQGITEGAIDKVVFVGGGSQMPRLMAMFKQKFSTSEVLNNINPEEVLARGAAMQASLLTGREDIVLDSTVCGLDCLSKNVGLKVIDDGKEKFEIIIPKDTPIPTRRSKQFDAPIEQTSVCISIFESENSSIDSGCCLAKLVMKDLPEDKDKVFILTFEVNKTGSLIATLMEKNSNKTENVIIHMRNS